MCDSGVCAHECARCETPRTCDSSNCVHCQPNAERFRHIVNHAFHPRGEGCGCEGEGGGSLQKKLKRVAMSRIWDFDTERVDVGVDAGVDAGLGGEPGTCERGSGMVRFSRLGMFRGCPRSPVSTRGVHQQEIISGLEWEPSHGCLLATAGVSKQVRVYSLGTLALEDEETRHDPIRLYRMASKLTSLVWNPVRSGVVCVGDYDGCVTEMDLETGHILHEGDEHSGRRVWSVSYAQSECMASASEDGTVAFWDRHRAGRSTVARITAPGVHAPVTGVEMSQWNSHLVGMSSANSCAYVYDMRQLSAPVRTLRGHTRPVSYFKFLDQNTVVTAGIDSSLVSWDLRKEKDDEMEVAYVDHRNTKHFVGLSVLPEEGLLSCGSETGHAFCYEKGRSAAAGCYIPEDLQTAEENKVDGVFCSAVAWRPYHASAGRGPVIAVALSDARISVCRLR